MKNILLNKIKIMTGVIIGATIGGIAIPMQAKAAEYHDYDGSIINVLMGKEKYKNDYDFLDDRIIRIEPIEEFPKIDWDKTFDIVRKTEPVNQYDIQPGKFYILRIPSSSGPTFSFDSIGYIAQLVKVTKVYECPERFWTERTVEYISKPNGKTEVIQPNKGWNKPLFCELTNEMQK